MTAQGRTATVQGAFPVAHGSILFVQDAALATQDRRLMYQEPTPTVLDGAQPTQRPVLPPVPWEVEALTGRSRLPAIPPAS